MAIYSFKNEIILFDELYLTEDNVFKKKGDPYFIAVDLSDTRNVAFVKDPYLKIYKGKKFTQASNEIRLSLLDAKLVEHSGKELLTINSDLYKWLKVTLPKKSTNAKYKDLSVYDAAWMHVISYAKDNKLEYSEQITLDKFMEKFNERYR